MRTKLTNILTLKLTRQFISLVVLPPVACPLGLVSVLEGLTFTISKEIPSVFAATCATCIRKKEVGENESTSVTNLVQLFLYLGVDPLSNLHSTMGYCHCSIHKVDTHKHSVGGPVSQPKPHWGHSEPTLTPTVCLQSEITTISSKRNLNIWYL